MCARTGAGFLVEKLDGCFIVMGGDHSCNVEGMGTVRIKMDDSTRIEESEVYTLTQKESYLSWYFENIGSYGIYTG